MAGTVISAHNPMTGPRHLGHYASTMASWPRLAAEGQLIVVIDDLIAALLYPKGRNDLELRTLSAVREFMALEIDFGNHHIVLTSMVPEVHELAFFVTLHLDEAWCRKLYRESFAGILSSYQRAEIGLPSLPSVAEVVYPQCHLAALTLGLGADYFQGGEEMLGYMHIMEEIARKVPVLRPPKFIAGARFVLGTDGNHMGAENAIYVSAPREQIQAQVAGVTDVEVFANWASALRDTDNFKQFGPDSLNAAAVPIKELRAQVGGALVAELEKFSAHKLRQGDMVAVLERSSAFAREKLNACLTSIKRELKITGFA